ncbi:MAG: hypothetical protein NVSMB18_11570 [Acetobacteraceae bacterium]
MKDLMIAAGLCVAALAGSPAQAAGCASGAAAGAVVGHVAGHHGLLGAGAGCAIGHHENNKQKAQQTSGNNAPPNAPNR